MNRIAIIVGVGSGLGMALAKKFGSDGFDVVLMGRNTAVLEKQVAQLSAIKIKAYAVTMDVTHEESVKNAFDYVKSLDGEIEVLIYNPVARRNQYPSQLTADDMISDFKVIVTGAVVCVSQVLAYFEQRGKGTLLFTGGGVALVPSLGASSMSLCKAALRNYAIALGNELRSKGIYVAIVSIMNAINDKTGDNAADIADTYYRMHEQKKEPEVMV